MYPKEIYNSLGFQLNPMKAVAMATIFIEIFRFWDLTFCRIFIKFGENVYSKQIYSSLSFQLDQTKTVAMATIFCLTLWVFRCCLLAQTEPF